MTISAPRFAALTPIQHQAQSDMLHLDAKRLQHNLETDRNLRFQLWFTLNELGVTDFEADPKTAGKGDVFVMQTPDITPHIVTGKHAEIIKAVKETCKGLFANRVFGTFFSPFKESRKGLLVKPGMVTEGNGCSSLAYVDIEPIEMKATAVSPNASSV